MVRLHALLFSSIALAALAFPALADDPFMTESGLLGGGGSACVGTYWCFNVGVASDPIGGTSTLVYEFNNGTTEENAPSSYGSNAGIPTVTNGDVLLTELGGAVGDVVRFENDVTISSLTSLSGASQTTTPSFTGAVAFIYSYDIAGGLAADVGAPASYQTNTVTLAESAQPYTPGLADSSAPGYGPSTGNSTVAQNTQYYLMSVDTPEPSLISLLAAMLGMVALGFVGFRLRRLSN